MSDILQKSIFLGGEGDSWWSRNRSRVGTADNSHPDPVLATIDRAEIVPRRVLEIGCSNGWRLAAMSRKYDAKVVGIDPSEQAVSDARSHSPPVDVVRGTADELPFDNDQFDLVIFGFCLYLCDRADLFRIVSEADRVLSDGGNLIVYDFYVRHPYRRVYQPDPRLSSYKMDHAGLFLAHPAYTVVRLETVGTGSKIPVSGDETVGVVLMKKNLAAAFPLRSV